MNNNLTDMQEIISSLETKDKNYAKISKALKILYFILIPFYVVMTILELCDSFTIKILIKGLGFVLSMLIFAIVFAKYHKEYNTVDYALPTLQMLKKAAYRYKPFRKETWWVILAILLIDMSMAISVEPTGNLFMLQVVFFLSLAVSLTIGMVLWWYKYKPLRDRILKVINDIES